MIVGYVLKMYPRFSETFVLNEILELERQGVKVRIFSLVKPDDGRFHAKLAQVQAKVSYLPQYPLLQFGQVWPACLALMRRDASRFWKNLFYALTHPHDMGLKQFLRACVLADTLGSEPVDHLHAHFASSATSVAMLAYLFTGIPYSFTAHAKDIYLDSIDLRLQRDKLTSAQFVVTVSEFNRSHLSALVRQGSLPGRRSASIRRLYNGIDLSQFEPSLRQYNDATLPLVLSVGRLVEKKGFEDLIRACAILRDAGVKFTCEIVGKGPRESALLALIAALDLSGAVRLIGPKPSEAIVSDYARATVFALPCLVGADGNRDGTPTVLVEAMAMGIPVISTRLTGIPEIVDDGSTGLLVLEHDPAGLAGALTRLLKNPALRASMGSLARSKAERDFDVRKNVALLHQWFEGIDTQLSSARPLQGPISLQEPIRENTISVR